MPTTNARQDIQSPAIVRGEAIPESGTVTVACNLAISGVVLATYDFEEIDEPVFGGGIKTIKQAVPTGDTVEINGTATIFGAAPRCRIVAGYALTSNVSAQFMARWFSENVKNPMVLNGSIKAWASEPSAVSWSKENRERRSGLEPLVVGMDAKGHPLDKRIPKPRLTAGGSGPSAIDADAA